MIVALFIASFPCSAFGGALGGPPQKHSRCDAANITIKDACNCMLDLGSERREWGTTQAMKLVMPRSARVTSGESVEIAFTLEFRDAESIDFTGGEVIELVSIVHGDDKIKIAKCTMGSVTGDPGVMRLNVPAGGKVHGTVSFAAKNALDDDCLADADALPPGSYTLTFSTVSGTPPLEVKVRATVR